MVVSAPHQITLVFSKYFLPRQRLFQLEFIELAHVEFFKITCLKPMH